MNAEKAKQVLEAVLNAAVQKGGIFADTNSVVIAHEALRFLVFTSGTVAPLEVAGADINK